MFFVIYSFYVDAFNFVRKNIFLIFILLIADFVRGILQEVDIMPFNLISWLFWGFLIPCFINLYLVVFILKSANYLFIDKSIREIINKNYKSALLIYIIGNLFWIILAGLVIVAQILFLGDLEYKSPIWQHVVGIFFSFFYFIYISFPIIPFIVKNLKPVNTFVFSFKEFQNHGLYYFLIFGFSIVLKFFPSLITPIGLVSTPFIQIVEYNLYREVNIFTEILYKFIEIWTFVALLYAFLYKNNFQPDKIVNPKAEIVN